MAEKTTVTVHLKGPHVVGLPDEIMSRSKKLARDHGGRHKWTFSFDNRIFVADLDADAIARLREHPAVEKVVEEGKTYLLNTPIPDYNPAGVNTDWGTSDIKSPVPWNKGYFGQGVKLAILDTGIYETHEAFWKDGVTIFKGGYDFVNSDNNPHDDHGHGTWCCGIAAAQHNSIAGSYQGVAPGVDLYAVKVVDASGVGSTAWLAAGIDWCRTNGIDIISMSVRADASDILQQACDNAFAAGCLLVAAAGNYGPSSNTVSYPAKYASVIAVAAVDRDELVASFSSRGPEVELSAPGVAVVGPCWSDSQLKWVAVAGSNYRYACDDGTSAACPFVAAAAAVIKSKGPALTNARIRQILIDYAKDI